MLVAKKHEKKPDHNLDLIPIIPYAYDNPVIYKQFTDNNVNQPK